MPEPREGLHVYNLPGSSAALYLSLQEGPFIAVEQTEQKAHTLYEDMRFFRTLLKRPPDGIHFLPEPDGPASSGIRAETVLSLGGGDVVVTSAEGFKVAVWRPKELSRDSLLFTKGQETERAAAEEKLRNFGYRKVSVVMEQGEYSSRGWVLDVFPPTMDLPVRAEFFGDVVDALRSFDIASQRSLESVQSVRLLPVTAPLSGVTIADIVRGPVYLVDAAIQEEGALVLSRYDLKGEGADGGLLTMKGLGVYPDERTSLADVASALKAISGEHAALIVSSSEGQAERVRQILREGDLIAPVIRAEEVLTYDGSPAITTARLSAGLFLPGLLVLTEREIFGERAMHRPMRRSKISGLLTALDDITPGDFVVHREHGIGKFIALQQQRVDGVESDLVILEYAGGDRLYLPLYNIERIKKYSAEEGVVPSIDRLGGKTWYRKRERVKKAVKEMAEKLLRLYAEREVAKSSFFSPDTELHREFYGFFPYEETPDQVRSFEEISGDLESERPMERLLCGDVGYGKTEVAMRAAFKAVYDNKQVAVLVPTTILCEQHYHTFRSRFAAFPVRIDYLSRFKTKKEQMATISSLARGETDIIVGTHGLLGKGVSFSDLGLLIIDEEHRFGVAQKERIKELRKGIDVLSMTATPIPRTLQMALSGVRAMSVIETAPEERLAVRSVVSVFDRGLIREAIEREIRRGGQVIFVHNTVFDIEKTADFVQGLMPGVTCAVAHGQMAEKRLEEVVLRFIRGEIQVLISTTIIGSGMDIPTANTIIIDRADRIGLSDLYQLRGRVGRSNLQAYAYFLIPGADIVTEEAKKRLQAISEMSYLGAGFRLAMKDLEIRGAGNLLGPQQSGHVHAVGFDMYVEMLEKAVAEVKGVEIREEFEPTISLKVSALIPENYVEDLSIRLSLYRRIANARDNAELEDLRSEMRDRFGGCPDEVTGLLEVMRLKILARRLLVTAVTQTEGKVRVAFSAETSVKPESLSGLQKVFHDIRFHRDGFELGLQSERGVQDVLFKAFAHLER